MRISTLLLLLFPLILNAQYQRKQSISKATILKNINIIDVENSCIVEGVDIVIQGGIIKIIGHSISSSAEDKKELDMTGKYAIPGLIDAHVHIANSSALKYQDGVDDLKYLIDRGVTSVRDVGGDARLLSIWKRAIDINDIEGPDIYYSAFLATRDYYGEPSRDNAMTGGIKDEFAAWAQLVNPGDNLDSVMIAAKAVGVTGVKIYLGYDKKFTKELVDAARRHGLEPWSHSMLFPAKPSEVAAAGVKVLSHAYMFEWENVEGRGNSVNDAYKKYDKIDRSNIDVSEYVKYALENDAILDATLYISFQNKMGEFSADVTKKVYQAGAKVSAGTDWILKRSDEFPPIYDEINLLIDHCGFSNIDAIRSATIIAAETFAGEKQKGSITEGKDADIVILNGNPIDNIANLKQIEHVIKKGKFINLTL